MDVRACSGWVESLRGQMITFTGKVTIDEARVNRAECAALALSAHAVGVLDDVSGVTTLLVHGDLVGQVVRNPTLAYSNKLIAVQKTRTSRDPGVHVHVVDSNGFADLLDGTAVRCRRLHRSGNGIAIKKENGEGILGGRVKPRKVGTRSTAKLSIDLDALDAATTAHEATVVALAQHLKRQGIDACGPHRGAPQFDIGWPQGTTVFVGEVKSLNSTNQAQQIRLGLGQVLDYAYQLDGLRTRGNKVRPVLILEEEPDDARWGGLADSLGVLLTYGPLFPGVSGTAARWGT